MKTNPGEGKIPFLELPHYKIITSIFGKKEKDVKWQGEKWKYGS